MSAWGRFAEDEDEADEALVYAAAHCLRFMGGVWRPEVLPTYLTLYEVIDVDAMIEVLS